MQSQLAWLVQPVAPEPDQLSRWRLDWFDAAGIHPESHKHITFGGPDYTLAEDACKP